VKPLAEGLPRAPMFAGRRGALLALALLVALALLPRLATLDRQGLWADEVFSLAMATGHSLEHPAAVAEPAQGDYVEHPTALPASAYAAYLAHDVPAAGPRRVVRAVFLSDTSPPLYYVGLYGWTLWAGTSDVALRLFSVLWAIACLPLLWSLGRQLGGRSAAWIACLLFALAPVAIRYSTEGRMYSMLWFFVLLTAWSALRLHRRGGSAANLALFAIGSAGGLLTHYFFFVVWVALLVWLVWQPGLCDRRLVALAAVATAVLVVPWYSQLPASLAGWRVTQDWLTVEPRRYRALYTPFEALFSYFSVRVMNAPSTLSRKYLLLTLLGVLVALWMIDWRRRGRRVVMVLLWVGAACVGPLLFDMLRGTYASAISRYALAGLPAAFLLVAAALGRAPFALRGLVLAALVVVWLPGYQQLYFGKARSRASFHEMAQAIEARRQPSDLILVHAIPSVLIGLARYLDPTAEVASWVGQLGQRRVPDDLEAFAAGRERVILVAPEYGGAPTQQESYLRERAAVVDESRSGSLRLMLFVPRGTDRFAFPAPEAGNGADEGDGTLDSTGTLASLASVRE
jgi:uncharacterized membrane protein